MDFGLRLISKFKFNPKTFWKTDNFPKIHREDLYPANLDDPLCEITAKVKTKLVF